MAENSKPSLKERLQAAYRTFVGGDAKGFNWQATDLPGNIYSSNRTGRSYAVPGTVLNWDMLTGDLWRCPAVQACLNWIFRNFPQAPPTVKQKDGKGEWTEVPNHPLIALLNRPNPVYDGSILFQGWILSLLTNGNGYAVIERTNGGDVGELWWVPHGSISPFTLPSNDQRFVDYYEYWFNNQYLRVPPEDVIHLKMGMHPYDSRLGISPLASANRDVNALQQAANYRPTILRNFGAAGAVISQKPGSDIELDPKSALDMWRSRTTGDNVAGAFITNASLDIAFPKASPQDMALTTLEDRPEADICALLGLPIQVTGLHGGREAKTYANYGEAREAAWEECLIPLGTTIACQLGSRLFPELQRGITPDQLSKLRMAFDYSDIRPLQPDKDKIHERVNKAWELNLITLGQWYEMTGEPEPTDVPDWETLKQMRYRDFNAPPAQEPDADETDTSNATDDSKTLDLRELMPKDWAEPEKRELRLLGDYQPVVVGNGHKNGNGVH